MSSPSLPNIKDLRSLSDARKSAVLDLLFEPSPEIHKALIPVIDSQHHTSYNDFIEACRKPFLAMASKSTAVKPNQDLLSILGSHPRLGAKKVESAQSVAEQARLGGESKVLARLNREYEEKFPGLRYVVFVNGRGREEIMKDMKARMDRGDFEKEVDAAVNCSPRCRTKFRASAPYQRKAALKLHRLQILAAKLPRHTKPLVQTTASCAAIRLYTRLVDELVLAAFAGIVMTDTLVRLGYEAFEVIKVPGSVVQYASRYPAWRPGADLPPGVEEQPTKTKTKKSTTTGVFGGVVYAQAPLAAARAIDLEERQSQAPGKGYMGIHSIQGVFTVAGHSDRPFVHEVTAMHTGKSFATRLVQTRQPKTPSVIDPQTGTFNSSDATKELNGVCFTCLTTFKRSMPSPDDVQEKQSPQVRFASILAKKRPEEWQRPYIVHIDSVQDQVVRSGQKPGPGTFPVLEMYRVDLSDYNKDKAVPQRRELLLYRPYEPIPQDDPNGHIVCHAFEADRNGITMLGCHLGYGNRWGRAASLSYAFYVHVNAEDAVMSGDGWWIQEASWPRVAAGRCTMVSKIWSPEGKHVASGYQDGMVVPEDPSKL